MSKYHRLTLELFKQTIILIKLYNEKAIDTYTFLNELTKLDIEAETQKEQWFNGVDSNYGYKNLIKPANFKTTNNIERDNLNSLWMELVDVGCVRTAFAIYPTRFQLFLTENPTNFIGCAKFVYWHYLDTMSGLFFKLCLSA